MIEEKLLKKTRCASTAKAEYAFQRRCKRKRVDISTYKAYSLKARLQKTHPFLRFQKASTTYFIYVDDLTAEEVIHEVATSSCSSSSKDSEAEGNEAETAVSSHRQLDNAIITKDSSQLLYHVALTLKDIIKNTTKTSPKIPWSPTAKDLTLESALNLVPDQLFVAWTSGITTQPSDSRERLP